MNQTPFYSRRNQVYPVLRQGRAAVEKHFADAEDWRRERELYAALAGRLPLPAVLGTEPGVLVLEHLSYPTLLAELERQEGEGFDPAPWQLPLEGNLRNFLWGGTAGQITGLDLEGYGPDGLELCGARLAAAALAYAPADTAVKGQIAEVLAKELDISGALLDEARRALSIRRQGRERKRLSGIVLAGGASRRMGESKAELRLGGRTLLQRQVDKLHALGIKDIMLSGERCSSLPGTRTVPDEYRDQGPLGGLHACLRSARNNACLALSVDAPLIPAAALSHLGQSHTGGVTVLCHGKREEPLIGVYDRTSAGDIAAMLDAGERSVQALKRRVRWRRFDYPGPEELLMNCNTPEEFAAAKRLMEEYAAAGLAL